MSVDCFLSIQSGLETSKSTVDIDFWLHNLLNLHSCRIVRLMPKEKDQVKLIDGHIKSAEMVTKSEVVCSLLLNIILAHGVEIFALSID